MDILVHAKTGVRNGSVEKVDSTHFVVRVRERPIGGKANSAVVRALARYFNVPPSQVEIISGHTSRKKRVHIIQ